MYPVPFASRANEAFVAVGKTRKRKQRRKGKKKEGEEKKSKEREQEASGSTNLEGLRASEVRGLTWRTPLPLPSPPFPVRSGLGIGPPVRLRMRAIAIYIANWPDGWVKNRLAGWMDGGAGGHAAEHVSCEAEV